MRLVPQHHSVVSMAAGGPAGRQSPETGTTYISASLGVDVWTTASMRTSGEKLPSESPRVSGGGFVSRRNSPVSAETRYKLMGSASDGLCGATIHRLSGVHVSVGNGSRQ